MKIKNRFYSQASVNYQVLFIISAIAMIGLSIYLTNHYFAVKFPTGLTGGGLCNLSRFLNCDIATHSMLSNIAGIPISLMGILTGAFLLIGYLFQSKDWEGTIHFTLIVNFIGCLGLFLFSLIKLGALCPACTLYYIFSGLALFCFYKNSTVKKPALIPLISFGAVIAIASFIMHNNIQNKMKVNDSLAQSLISQYKSLPNLGAPEIESDYRITSATPNFQEAPIQITKFSDFECPACKMLSGILHNLAKKYEGKMNIQYIFYPLDSACNPSVNRRIHVHACQAAYLAACLPQKFPQIEEEIFNNQSELSSDSLNAIAKREGVLECMNSEETKEKVVRYIESGNPFNIKSTPTILLNGVKIEGVLPEGQLQILIDHLLSHE